ncbi:MAG TPA: carboxyltransferase domain-containing protein [Thermoanaerobaculia bacterium]
MRWTVAPAGDLGIRIAVGAVETRQLVAMARCAAAHAEVAAAIPAAESILLVFRERTSRATHARVVDAIAGAAIDESAPRAHAIAVSFDDADAPDLPRLLAHAGIGRDAFLDAVRRLRLRVRFLGFRPGFAYLEGIPRAWHLPRHHTPRARVPAGSFAIAGAMAGFYPEDSPGGWNLVGRSAARFWDPDAPAPNLLAPGDEVTIVPVPGSGAEPRARESRWPPDEAWVDLATVVRPATAMAIVTAPDLRHARWGLPEGGPFDREAAEAANHNVGNAEGTPLLECALSGPVLRFLAPATLSWCGGGGHPAIGGEPIEDTRSFLVDRGDELAIGPIDPGARGYLAVRGGLAAPPGLALPTPLHRGDLIRATAQEARPARFRPFERATPAEIVAIPGPDPLRDEWRELLERELWEVTPRSDRAGVRLAAARKAREIPASLPSAGMLFGTIQWHPDGDLVAMGPDHPITGGYLQPATIPSWERWKLAQLRPGDRIRWRLGG